MKTAIFRILSLVLLLSPLRSVAQTAIQHAFQRIIDCKDAKITSTFSLEKDPQTNIKISQADTYDFILPSGKMKLVKDVLEAFDKDSNKSYALYGGTAKKGAAPLSLAVGDAKSSVRINDPGTEFMYACFLAPEAENKEGIYRYAYGMNYKEEKNGEIVGKLVITYATTLKYRQEVADVKWEKQLDNWKNSQQSWFDRVVRSMERIPMGGSIAQIQSASKTLIIISEMDKYSDVTEAEKDAIREILAGMLNDSRCSETSLQAILKQCRNMVK